MGMWGEMGSLLIFELQKKENNFFKKMKTFMLFTIVWLYFGSRKNWVATVSLVVAFLKVTL